MFFFLKGLLKQGAMEYFNFHLLDNLVLDGIIEGEGKVIVCLRNRSAKSEQGCNSKRNMHDSDLFFFHN